jgi:hypothetical protein
MDFDPAARIAARNLKRIAQMGIAHRPKGLTDLRIGRWDQVIP